MIHLIMSHLIIVKLILAVVGTASAWQVFNALRTMKTRGRYGGIIDRYQRPWSFWTMVVVHCLSISVFLGIILLFSEQPSQNRMSPRLTAKHRGKHGQRRRVG
jgi:hypothetical protein